jgi:hypothetical protein
MPSLAAVEAARVFNQCRAELPTNLVLSGLANSCTNAELETV